MKIEIVRGLMVSTILLFIFSIAVTAVSAQSVAIAPEETTGLAAGDTFTVTVDVNSGTSDLRAINLKLLYDSNWLEVTGATEDGLLGTSILVAPGSEDNGAGTISYGIAVTGGSYAPASGTFLTINFKVKASAPDNTYDLDLTDVVLKDQNNAQIASVAVTDGKAVVGTPVICPTVEVLPEETTNQCPNDPFTVTIEVDSDIYNLRAINLDMSYDSNNLEVTGITEEGLLGTSILVAPDSGDNGAGTISYGIAVTSGTYAPASGTFLTIDFKVKAAAPDATYNLALTNVVLKDQDNNNIPSVSVDSGTVEVDCDPYPCDFCFELEAGWNMVSIPKAIEGSNTATHVFKLGNGEVCLRYDPTVTPNLNPWEQFPNIIPCEGYMVYKQSDSTDYSVCVNFVNEGNSVPPELPLYKGWNLIGHPDVTSTSVDNFASFTGLSDTMTQLWHRSNDGTWTGYPNWDLTSVTPGHGYWAFLDDDDVMAGTP